MWKFLDEIYAVEREEQYLFRTTRLFNKIKNRREERERKKKRRQGIDPYAHLFDPVEKAPTPPPSPPEDPRVAVALRILQLAAKPTSDQELHKAWIQAIRKTHPDAGGSDFAAKQVNAAYEFLKRL